MNKKVSSESVVKDIRRKPGRSISQKRRFVLSLKASRAECLLLAGSCRSKPIGERLL